MKKKNSKAVKLGKYLKSLREKIDRYKKRTNFANEINEPPQKISNYEHGENFPTIEMLIKIQKVLNKPFEILLKPLIDISEENIELSEILNKIKQICKYSEAKNDLKKQIKYILNDIKEKEEKSKKKREPD